MHQGNDEEPLQADCANLKTDGGDVLEPSPNDITQLLLTPERVLL